MIYIHNRTASNTQVYDISLYIKELFKSPDEIMLFELSIVSSLPPKTHANTHAKSLPATPHLLQVCVCVCGCVCKDRGLPRFRPLAAAASRPVFVIIICNNVYCVNFTSISASVKKKYVIMYTV